MKEIVGSISRQFAKWLEQQSDEVKVSVFRNAAEKHGFASHTLETYELCAASLAESRKEARKRGCQFKELSEEDARENELLVDKLVDLQTKRRRAGKGGVLRKLAEYLGRGRNMDPSFVDAAAAAAILGIGRRSFFTRIKNPDFARACGQSKRGTRTVLYDILKLLHLALHHKKLVAALHRTR